jgi:hypothetical protein
MLDMTGRDRPDLDVHYRRYLSHDNRPAIICVQDFDYYDYDASRFLDRRAFSSEEEARQAPIDLTEMIIEATDSESAAQVLRNIRAVHEHLASEAARWPY